MAQRLFNVSLLWKRHWLFILGLFSLGPACGYAMASDRGLLFGLVVAVLASCWLLWSQHEREPH